MHIFIDESGTFTQDGSKPISFSAVGGLIIPDSSMPGFMKLYGRLRKQLPQQRGEIKGRFLNESQITKIVEVLKRVGGLYEVVAIDIASHSEEEIKEHQADQAERMTKHLTPEHQDSIISEIWSLRRQLEKMAPQLYVQSVAQSELIYDVLNHSDTYFAFRQPSELAEYHWVIDAKGRDERTAWEKWWSKMVLSMLESKTFRKPFMSFEGGDYRAHDRFRTELSGYKKRFTEVTDRSKFLNINLIMTEDFRFSSESEFGLEAADILTNAVRRSLAGNLQRSGWRTIPGLMIHRRDHYIKFISLKEQLEEPKEVPYRQVLIDFSRGGRSLVPEHLFD